MYTSQIVSHFVIEQFTCVSGYTAFLAFAIVYINTSSWVDNCEITLSSFFLDFVKVYVGDKSTTVFSMDYDYDDVSE